MRYPQASVPLKRCSAPAGQYPQPGVHTVKQLEVFTQVFIYLPAQPNGRGRYFNESCPPPLGTMVEHYTYTHFTRLILLIKGSVLRDFLVYCC
jgi:hypothetical protein